MLMSHGVSWTDLEVVEAARVRECPSDLRKQETAESVARDSMWTQSAAQTII